MATSRVEKQQKSENGASLTAYRRNAYCCKNAITFSEF